MENVTDEVSNPFGMRPPCRTPCSPDHLAVLGYGDANADFHVIGDHPGVHGGHERGIPFTGTEGGRRLRSVLGAVGLLEDPTSPTPGPQNCFLSYLHPCCLPGDRPPTHEDYATMEPFFDAELRAITADVLIPVGDRPLARVLEHYTGRAHRLPADATHLHASEVPGSGFLVVPLRTPDEWTDDDETAALNRLRSVVTSDYHQMADLGRFMPDDDPYYVR